MSFLFGKKNKQQPASALPPAVRDISSSSGPTQPPPVSNGANVRDVEKSRGGPAAGQTSTPSGSVNNSLSSLQNAAISVPPEPKALRERADSNLQNPNSRTVGNPLESPYPWSSRRLNFASGNPFPRYGAAINATASKDGTIYIMGGLVGSIAVKGDLWLTEMNNGNMTCFPVATTGDGPGPRVGHASLLVGNAFIVFGGDTKSESVDNDDLDDTLYLLNTSTKHWSRALPQGPRPTGRYGHTLNILGSRIYIFGGQVEGFFFNDLVAFDLNSLQSSASRWDVLLPNNKEMTSSMNRYPPARTNHSMISWNDKLYLFGGTNGVSWFNDVWTYEPRSNAWTELDCIGYIPVAREGHSAALVNDTMYIFGGRTQEGVDLGDLAAFRISSRRWYMFQNMGHSPSPRSGHSMTAFGKHIITLAGEPSSPVSDRNELSLAYMLDTSKIRYPLNETAPPPQQQPQNTPRKTSSGDRSIPLIKSSENLTRESMLPGPPARNHDGAGNGMGVGGSRLPRASPQAPSGPPPIQQPPQPRMNGNSTQSSTNARSKTPTKNDRVQGSSGDLQAPSVERPSMERNNFSSPIRDGPSANDAQRSPPEIHNQRVVKESVDTTRSGSSVSRSNSRSHRQQLSQESVEQGLTRQSSEAQRQRAASREAEREPLESASTIALVKNQQNDELVKELELAKSRNAWYASELTLARKAGYNIGRSTSPIHDERSIETFREEDKPLIEALLRMKTELERVQASIKTQGEDAALRIAEVEKQRDAAVSEAIYAKAKLAAHGGGSQNGTPQPDGARSTDTPDTDRVQDINRRLAASLSAQGELSAQVEQLTKQADSEKRAKELAEEIVEAAQKRVQELDSTRQKNAAEFERLRAELHEAEQVAREVSSSAGEAEASAKLLAIDKQELITKVASMTEESRKHSSILESLREGVLVSSEKSALLEQKLESERVQSDHLRQKLAQLRAEHEAQVAELDVAAQKLRDTEELAEKHAEEARHHQQAILSGLGSLKDRSAEDTDAADERVVVLRQQIEAANSMARKNQVAANQASEKLRRAEERIAGLESYQEQSSREGLAIRKQLQQAMRDVQTAETEKDELRQNHERVRLESNAVEVQLKTLKNLLEERGVNSVDSRRSRALDSPNSRFGTPELNRVRELEQQVDAMNKAHEELRVVFEEREHEVSKEWEEKLQALHNDHQAAVKYLRGTEKMLAKMKQELDRYKNVNSKLEDELKQAKHDLGSLSKEQASAWEAERVSLRQELENTQDAMKTTVARLESQCAKLQADLASAREEITNAATGARQAESAAAQSRLELEAIRRQYTQVEERAREAESRVQMFLDQFETSVDNYRRQSHLPLDELNGSRHHHHDSLASIDSTYSHTDDSSTPEGTIRPSSSGTRNSMALDNLASELDALRSHWETTNKAYRMSERYDFERTPTSDKNEMSESLSQWNSQMDWEGESLKEGDKGDTKAVHPDYSAATNLAPSPPPS